MKRLKITPWHFLLLYAALGLAFFLLSGMAEGPKAPRNFTAFFIFILLSVRFVHVLPGMMRRLRVRKNPVTRAYVIEGLGFAVMVTFIVQGLTADRALIAETIRRGDTLIENLAAFRTQKGRCPADLAEFEAHGFAVPQPALARSRFRYRTDGPARCRVSFGAPVYKVCERRVDDTSWRCRPVKWR